ncbi:MAG: DUF1501 domain-containing protein [Acidimicrobiales bacterium]|nr:DUF1501 domain-containing protein [Acidimicrobiales bacterium]
MTGPTRRGFLRGVVGTGALGVGTAAAGIPVAGAEGRGVAEPGGTVVVIHLVGGVDGLSVLVPYGDEGYQRRRPSVAVAAPGERYGAIELDRGLGLHPALAPLWNRLGPTDRLAVICGVGVPDGDDGNRNHLPSRDFLYRGGRHEPEGWAARLLRFEGLDGAAVWSFGPGPHPMFDGLAGAVAAPRPTVSIGPHRDPAGAFSAVGRAHGGGSAVGRAGQAALAASGRWSDTAWTSAADRLARGYPEGRLGRSLAVTADMIREERGLRLVAIDHGGYDTHVDQGDGKGGVLAHRLDRLARGVSAFWDDLDGVDERPPVTVVVVSEFGRAIDENGSGGTEHGRGGVALALGDRVVGGVHGDLPDLDRDDVWPVSVDVRRVCADAVSSHGFRPWRGGVFPGLPLPNRSLGLLLSP